MHYGDPQHLQNNHLMVVVYKCEIMQFPFDYEYEITSIKQCNLFRPRILRDILNNPDNYFEEILKGKGEDYYCIMLSENNTFKVDLYARYFSYNPSQFTTSEDYVLYGDIKVYVKLYDLDPTKELNFIH